MHLTRDRVGGLIFLALSLSYGYHAGQLEMLPGDEFEPFTARTMPLALAAIGTLLSSLLFITAMMKPVSSDDQISVEGFDLALTGKLLGLIVLFGLALHWIGFLLATVLFLLGGYWLLATGRASPEGAAACLCTVRHWHLGDTGPAAGYLSGARPAVYITDGRLTHA